MYFGLVTEMSDAARAGTTAAARECIRARTCVMRLIDVLPDPSGIPAGGPDGQAGRDVSRHYARSGAGVPAVVAPLHIS